MTIESKQECKRISHIFDSSNIELIQQDVGKKFFLEDGIDYIIHAASKASPKEYLSDPIGTIDANVNGTRQLLEYSVTNKVESFLFFSSGEIYGDPCLDDIPTKEDYLGRADWLAPRSCYTESKRFSETLCINFFYKYKIPIKIVRPVHIYGPGLRLNDGRVISDFLKDGLAGKDINILSDGLASRGFCYVSDATIAFWNVLLNGRSGQVYNVGNDKEETSIRDLAKTVAQIFDNKISINFYNKDTFNYLAGSPGRSCPSVDKLRQEFDYEPQVCLRDGLLKLKNWYEVQ